MTDELIIKSEYKITFKRFFLDNNFFIKPLVQNEQEINDAEFQIKLKSKFIVYGIDAKDIMTIQSVYLRKLPYVEIFNICIYKAMNKEDRFSAMEIMDVFVPKKYRRKGIGKQLMLILEEIARQNDIKYIVGELQEDKKDEPLEMRKKFFEKNGFEVWNGKQVNFSGWVIKKLMAFGSEL